MALHIPRIPQVEPPPDLDESDGSSLTLFVILVGEVVAVGIALWWFTAP
jgi:hypothetical protein